MSNDYFSLKLQASIFVFDDSQSEAEDFAIFSSNEDPSELFIVGKHGSPNTPLSLVINGQVYDITERKAVQE